jgi:hypothetical protein
MAYAHRRYTGLSPPSGSYRTALDEKRPFPPHVRRESQPMIPPSTAPISGAKGTSVDTLTRMPSANPATAPSAIAAPTLMPMNLSGARY